MKGAEFDIMLTSRDKAFLRELMQVIARYDGIDMIVRFKGDDHEASE